MPDIQFVYAVDYRDIDHVVVIKPVAGIYLKAKGECMAHRFF